MRDTLIMLLGGSIAWLAGTLLSAILAGTLAGAAVIMSGVIWPRAVASFIDPVNRPRQVTRKDQLLLASAVALVGMCCLLVALMAPLDGYPALRSFGAYFGGLGFGMASAMLLTERRTREAHNRSLAAMSVRPESEWKS